MGVSWFGNSRGVADGECGEIASGSQEASSGPMPGHNNSLSVAPARFGLSAPGNTQFTQAQNAAFFSSSRLVATVVFALCPQASRAIKKVLHCSRGLPFKGWSLEPSDETQMSRGGVLFPGRGTPAISWQIPKGGEQRLLRAHGKEGGDGAGMGPRVCKGHVHTSQRPACTRTQTHLEHSLKDMLHTRLHVHTHMHDFMHIPANECINAWAHTDICTEFQHYGDTYLREPTLICRRFPKHKCMSICMWIKERVNSGTHRHSQSNLCKIHKQDSSKTFKACIL